jgi:hypothetical protein
MSGSMSDPTSEQPAQEKPVKMLTPAAQRALAEAAERRAALDEQAKALATQAERNGRGGLDPVRYNDWEVKGLTVDF